MEKSDFQIGRESALEDLQEGQIDLMEGFMSFKTDMPDNDFLWGYFSQLYELIADNEE